LDFWIIWFIRLSYPVKRLDPIFGLDLKRFSYPIQSIDITGVRVIVGLLDGFEIVVGGLSCKAGSKAEVPANLPIA
jgi:hypothetical protein